MVTLELLGELVRQLQADMRTLRSDVDAIRRERGDMVAVISDMVLGSERRVMDRIAAMEADINTRLDRLEGGTK